MADGIPHELLKAGSFGFVLSHNYQNRVMEVSSDYAFDHAWSDVGYLLSGVSISTIGVLAFCGNSLVVGAFLKDKKLRTPTNLFILSISISDLAISIVGNPFSASSNFAGRWLYGLAACKWYAFANNFLGLVSLNTHAMIAIDRYIVITKNNSGPIITQNKAVIMASMAWLWSFLWALFPLLGWSTYYFEGPGTMCSVHWQSTENHTLSYIMCLFVFSFLLPICIMVVCYGCIYTTVKKSSLAQAAWDSASEAARKNHELQNKILRMMGTIAVAYLIAWAPYSVIAMWATFGDAASISKTAAAIPSIFAKSGSMYNPVIYVAMNKPMRNNFKKIVNFRCDFSTTVTTMSQTTLPLHAVHNNTVSCSVIDKQMTSNVAVIPGQIQDEDGTCQQRVVTSKMKTATVHPEK